MTTAHKTEITLIAEAIIANTRLIEMLINKLPDATRVAVAAVVDEHLTPAPAVVQAPAPVQAAPVAAPAPVQAPVAPVVAPTPAPVAAMPPVPVFTQAAPAVAPVTSAPAFDSKQKMIDFVISSYKALGNEKGSAIQNVLTGMGYNNINDIPADQWVVLKNGIEALKG